MEAEQETQENVQTEEETYQEVEQESATATSETVEQDAKETEDKNPTVNNQVDRTKFFHGLAVGLGIGCIATFVIVWITVFFAPRMPSGVTYENLLAIFVYPLIYLLAIGLIALTAGVVKEYYPGSKA
ncbi:MAG TPA: hypothetical protein VMS94_06170 [Acidobacteriota bacterium]|jgi:hypothetical protein|nr:hypothetical protein [Acidobacteriota bacterium]